MKKKGKNSMKKANNVCIDINVTKIVKYVCLAGVVIVSIVFGERGYERFLRAGRISDGKR